MKNAVLLEERGILAIGGSQRREFLQGLISNDVEQVGPSGAVYAALLTPQGKFLFEFFIAELGDVLLLDTDRDRLPDLQRRLMMYKLRSDAAIADRSADFAVYALLGPVEGIGGTPGAAPDVDGGVIFADPRSARLGARAVLPRAGAADALEGMGFAPAPFVAYEALRVAVGAADARRDLEVDKTLLLEANFDTFNGVSFSKGCYVGQELTARTKYRGNVRRRLYPVLFEGAAAPGAEVLLGDKPAGQVRSVAGNRGIALLRIEDVDQAREQGASLTAGSATLHVEALAP
ncbi:folate-binding protein [Emcibacter sp. SYSU 3D8]|uniref:CAF17-like 4Fe-4S cluster assembly/insertion protein YgfZ n=1 Tax=Emcibacter sp. SYSU 3D8 TaxID=3133969 RepID=UPI0031FED724